MCFLIVLLFFYFIFKHDSFRCIRIKCFCRIPGIEPLYAAEVRGRWKVLPAVLLSIVKGLHWGLSMEMDAVAGSLISAIFCSLLFHGIQHGVDVWTSGKEFPRPWYALWSRSWLSQAQIVDSYLHLAVFSMLSGMSTSPFWLAVFNVIGHTVGMIVTYPAVSIQRRRAHYFDGFLYYYIRSSLASFFITLAASLWMASEIA